MSFVIEDEKRVLPCEIAKTKGDKLGDQGLYGQIFLSGEDDVLKTVKFDKKSARKDFFNEVALTIRSDQKGYGPIDVKYGECKKEKYGFMIMKRGALLKNHRQYPDRIDFSYHKILKVLSLMHKDGVFHQDTHIGNFIYYPDLGEYRIIDYGFAIQCGQDLTGTVAAAYDIMKAMLQLVGLNAKPGKEDISKQQMSRLTKYLDGYWEQPSFQFIMETVFRFTNYFSRLDSYGRSGAILFTRKLCEQVPTIKSQQDLDWFLNNKLMVTVFVEGFIDTSEIFETEDVVMKTESKHRRSLCFIL